MPNKSSIKLITGYHGLNEVGKKLSSILIRRTKQEVLKQLPGRMDKNLFVPLTKEQRELHTGYKDVVARLVNKWRNFGFLSEQDRQRLLINLNLMRMVCDTTYIIDQSTNFQTKLDELFNILDELFIIKGEKIVIFSQWERMTRLIAIGLTDRKVKFEYLQVAAVTTSTETENDSHTIITEEEDLLDEEQDMHEDNENVKSSAASLVENGVSFFSQLIQTLQDEKALKLLTDSITEKDEKTGQLYLKLPVNNNDTVTQALNLFAGLLKGLGK